MSDDEIYEAKFEKLANPNASITDETIYEFERIAQSNGVGKGRRLALTAVA